MAILHWHHRLAGIESLCSALGRRQSTATGDFCTSGYRVLVVAGILIGSALAILASSTSSHAQTSIGSVEPLNKPRSVNEVRSEIDLIKKHTSKKWRIHSQAEDGSGFYIDQERRHGEHVIMEHGGKNDGEIIEEFDFGRESNHTRVIRTYTYARDGTVTAELFDQANDRTTRTTWAPDGTITTEQTQPTKIPFVQYPGTSTSVLVQHPDESTTTTVTITDREGKIFSTDTTSAPAFHSIVGELGTGTPTPPTNAVGGGGPPSTGGSAGPPPNPTPAAGPVAVLPPPPAATACPACKAIAGRIEDVDKQIGVTDAKIASWQRQDQFLRTNSNLKAAATKKSLDEIAKDTADLKAQRAQLVAKREQLEAQKATCETQCTPPPPTSTNAEPTNSDPPPDQPQSAPGNAGFQLPSWGIFRGSNQGSFGNSNQQPGFGRQGERGNGQQR